MTVDSYNYWKLWRPVSGAPKGKWRVCRGLCPMEELEDRNGRRILFRSLESARSRAEALNDAEALQ